MWQDNWHMPGWHHAQVQHRFILSPITADAHSSPIDSAGCVTTLSQTTSEKSLVILMRRPWWQHARGTFSSQKLKESLKLWFMLPCVVVSCLFLRSLLRSGMEISIKNPWLLIHSAYILKHSWVTFCSCTVFFFFYALPLHSSLRLSDFSLLSSSFLCVINLLKASPVWIGI